MKFVNSNLRVSISYDTVGMWYRDYANVTFHFLPKEIEGSKKDFVLAAGYAMKAAINNVKKGSVEKYNRDTCINDKYVHINFVDGTDSEKAEELVLKACDLLIEREFNKESTNRFIKLACKYEKEVKEFAKSVKNDIVNKTENYRVYVQHIPAD